MTLLHRRAVFQAAGAAGLQGLLGCGDDARVVGPEPGTGGGQGDRDAAGDARDCGEPSADAGAPPGELLEVLPFEQEQGRTYGEPTGSGLDGRLYTDLKQLDLDDPVTDSPSFYVRTRRPDGIDDGSPWTLSLGGLVQREVTLGLDELLELSVDQGTISMECSGNFRSGGFGLMSAGRFRGVPLEALFERVSHRSGSVGVRVDGVDAHSQPSAGGRSIAGASWVLSFDDVAETGAFLATHVNDEPLADDHGRPLRLLNPGWYGCSCIKWVHAIAWVDEREPSTSQMTEFASRTHQVGEPALARDYAAPEIQQAAMPVRVEKRLAGSRVHYRVIGIAWGGKRPITALSISLDAGERFEPVRLCPPVWQNRT